MEIWKSYGRIDAIYGNKQNVQPTLLENFGLDNEDYNELFDDNKYQVQNECETENGVENTENSVDNTENGANYTENGADNTENGANNTVNDADNTENGIDSTKHNINDIY
ncbi:hypothetical protein F8M41_003837 [Gigaspora margarita]|uniref:Uncharacterized protein n=1 Tax=Gigaspora margarita TaxID=4874 RepID=A0A8H3XC60_GIGMA|nr:hypothetical protein F8M41_003837 [Gigaspora margarita]